MSWLLDNAGSLGHSKDAHAQQTDCCTCHKACLPTNAKTTSDICATKLVDKSIQDTQKALACKQMAVILMTAGLPVALQ